MKLINGDCIEELQHFPDNSVDMVLSDLPYGTTRNGWDRTIRLDKLWEQLRRICKDNAAIVLFAAVCYAISLGIRALRK